MATDKPKVTVVLAIHRPHEAWLIEQLRSIDQQTYENMEILLWDDCPDYPVEESIIQANIKRFPYKLYRSRENLGSNGAFGELTKLAQSPLISYCDQDDIWEETKIAEQVDKLAETGAVLVCSDVAIMDAQGKKLADSIGEIRKRHFFREGTGLAPYLMVTNFVLGCTMMMKMEIAKRALPFEPYFVHDHWLALMAALEGSIAVISKPLVRYRQHGNNQTGILTGVQCKGDYYRLRIAYMQERMNFLQERLKGNLEALPAVEEITAWVNARADYFNKPNIRDAKIMLKYSEFGKTPVLLEIFLPLIPEVLFKGVVNMARRGVL